LTIPVSVHLSNKGCRLCYVRVDPTGNGGPTRRVGGCLCAEGRCWYRAAKAAHERGEAAPTYEEWTTITDPGEEKE